jgi:hypothetical protein
MTRLDQPTVAEILAALGGDFERGRTVVAGYGGPKHTEVVGANGARATIIWRGPTAQALEIPEEA